ncbi:hypothetical protein GALL_527450 [mine drainage metagenome]|uniref:Uncharacterized protein n=1 Tax=mine drainage metagenome TaxID=410659 RepID=A0A1J5PQ44_9ZZZZ
MGLLIVIAFTVGFLPGFIFMLLIGPLVAFGTDAGEIDIACGLEAYLPRRMNRPVRSVRWFRSAGGLGLNGCKGEVALVGLDVGVGPVNRTEEPGEDQCDGEDSRTDEIQLSEGAFSEW